MKEIKSPTTKYKRRIRKTEKPEIPLAKEPEMPLIKKPEEIVHKIKKAEILSTEYEGRILKICSKNKYPFVFKDGAVGRKVPDFINREKKLIIELYNLERGDKEGQERVTAFYRHGYKFIFLTRHNLARIDWERCCTEAIKGFLA